MTSVMKPANLGPAMKGNMSVAERRMVTAMAEAARTFGR